MSLRPVASLAVKLLSLWILIPLLDWVSNFSLYFNPSFNSAFRPNGIGLLIAAGVVPALMRLSLGVGLWLFADSLAASMVKNEVPLSHVPTPLEWQRLAFSVLGAYFCVSAAERLVRAIVSAWMAAQDPLVHLNSTPGPAEFASLLVQGALGMWLLLGVRGIANLRNVGRDATTS